MKRQCAILPTVSQYISYIGQLHWLHWQHCVLAKFVNFNMIWLLFLSPRQSISLREDGIETNNCNNNQQINIYFFLCLSISVNDLRDSAKLLCIPFHAIQNSTHIWGAEGRLRQSLKCKWVNAKYCPRLVRLLTPTIC